MLPDASYTLDPCDLDLVEALRTELSCTETLAWMLARRGVTPQEARALITEDPAQEQAQLHDPMLLGDMAAAVERITYAIEQQEQIIVHGDYDADGVCATTLLVEGLEQLGANVTAFLPDRFTNGYGLQLHQVEAFAQAGTRLLIAVDCGITAVEPVAHARDLGVDTIICDHHQPGPTLPDAILCSTRPSDYPFPELCATGVVGKLLVALGGPSGAAQHELEAIATIADCVPLVGENRVLVRRGLRALRDTKRPGLHALVTQAGMRTHDIDAEAVAFKIAPRINAVGRISQSEIAYDLLRSTPATAPALVTRVDALNEQRRAIERAITATAIETIETWSDAQRAARIYVVAGTDWHEGVVGIVASRLVERYARPVIVIAGGDPARGSGRSVDGVNLHAALASCDDLLLRWGGHAQAGGVTIDPTRIDELQERLAAWGEAHIPDALLSPRDRVDAIVPGHELTMELVHELGRLAPFGTAWERPLLLATDAQLVSMQAVGGDGTHLKCNVSVGDRRIPAIGFGMAPSIATLLDQRVDLAVRPSINRFRGTETLQVELQRAYAITEPSGSDVFLGWCAAGCAHDHEHKVRAEQLLAAATELVEPEIASANPERLPAIDPVLSRAHVVDLRNRGAGIEHVAQLMAAGMTVVALVADVPRRRDAFRALAIHDRFVLDAALLISEHVAPHVIETQLAELERTPLRAGARLIVSDHAAFAQLANSELAIDVVVVLDPPATLGARDRLATAFEAAHVHLVYGDRETRFSADVIRAAHDVRSTLADVYRYVRDTGPAPAPELQEQLLGAGPYPRSPAAIVHGVRSLLDRKILTLDAHMRLGVVQQPTEVAAGTAT